MMSNYYNCIFKRLFLLVLLLQAQTAFAEIMVYEPKHRDAAELAELITQFEPQAIAAVFEENIIIRGKESILEDVNALLASIDTAPDSILITVRQVKSGVQADRSSSAGATISNDSASIHYSTHEREGSGTDDLVQSIHSIEGKPVYIAIGEDRAVISAISKSKHGGTVITEDKTALRGFFATVYTNNDNVRIKIQTSNDQFSANNKGQVNIAQSATEVTGKVDEWILISRSDTTELDSVNRHYQTRSRSTEAARIEIKIQKLTQ